MFLKCSTRWKDGKEHRSWSIVESRRIGRGVAQRHVPYLGEINDSQQAAWQKAIAGFDEQAGQSRQCALFPEDRTPPSTDIAAVQVQLDRLQLYRPRSWGACWLGDQLWRDLQLDSFFAARLGISREGTAWEMVPRLLTLPAQPWPLRGLAPVAGSKKSKLAIDTRTPSAFNSPAFWKVPFRPCAASHGKAQKQHDS